MFNPASQVESQSFASLREKPAASFRAEPYSGNRPKPSVPNYGGLAPWQLIQVEKLIEKKLFEIIRIKVLADRVRLSESYFYSAFRRSTGQTPHALPVRRSRRRAGVSQSPGCSVNCNTACRMAMS